MNDKTELTRFPSDLQPARPTDSEPEVVFYAIDRDGRWRELCKFGNLEFSVLHPGKIFLHQFASPTANGYVEVATLFMRGRPVFDFGFGTGREFQIEDRAIQVGVSIDLSMTLELDGNIVDDLRTRHLWPAISGPEAADVADPPVW